jgi:hypothetical protein
MTEEDLFKGRLKDYRILFVTGTVAISDRALMAIKKFHDHGGHIFACARFAEMDENTRIRSSSPPDYFGVKLLERNQYPRQEYIQPPLLQKIQFNNHTEKTVSIERRQYDTSYPMQWESPLFRFFYDQGITYKGEPLGSGAYIGFEDMKVDKEIIERVTPEEGSEVLASFGPLKPGIVTRPQSVYVARDLSWSDATMAKLIHASVQRAGVERIVWVEEPSGSPPPQIDVGILKNQKGYNLIIITCSDKLLDWDGSPTPITVKIRTDKRLKELLSGEIIETKRVDDLTIFRKTFSPGDVHIITEIH